MKGGRLLINGRSVDLTPLGPGPTVSDGTPTRLLAEQLPGESGAHRVLDAFVTPQDDVSALKVPTGRLFVLGDNRDMVADSRISPEERGVGLVPVEQVIGLVDRLLWTKDGRRMGDPIDPATNPFGPRRDRR